jgi:hypothetical protein
LVRNADKKRFMIGGVESEDFDGIGGSASMRMAPNGSQWHAWDRPFGSFIQGSGQAV